jgi:hypothetical protein
MDALIEAIERASSAHALMYRGLNPARAFSLLHTRGTVFVEETHRAYRITAWHEHHPIHDSENVGTCIR